MSLGETGYSMDSLVPWQWAIVMSNLVGECLSSDDRDILPCPGAFVEKIP